MHYHMRGKVVKDEPRREQGFAQSVANPTVHKLLLNCVLALLTLAGLAITVVIFLAAEGQTAVVQILEVSQLV